MTNILYLTNGATIGSTGRILQHWLEIGREIDMCGSLVVQPGSEYADWGVRKRVPTLVNSMPCPNRLVPWNVLWNAARVASWARRRKVQAVHCNEHDVYPFANVLRKLLRVPVVCHVRYRLMRGFAKWAFGGKRCPDALLWTSHQQLADSAEAVADIVSPERQHVVRLGVDLSDMAQYETTGKALRHQLGVNDSEVLIGTASPLRPRKRLEDFISMMCRVIDRHPLCVGLIAGHEVPGDDDYRVRIERLIAESGKGRRLRWVGYHSPVEPFHHACDISVSTSEYETFGNSVCEAMACGKPVAAYSGGSVAEVVGNAGLVVPTLDLDALTHAVSQLVSSQELRRSLGERGRARVETEFNPRRSLRQLEGIYDSIACSTR